MIVYESIKRQFLLDNSDHFIEKVIEACFLKKLGKRVSPGELASWKNSLKEVAEVLKDSDIPEDVGVAVELHIPQTSKRIDVTLSGYGEQSERNAIIVELKQWEKIDATDKDAIVITYLGGSKRETVHPSYQAWSYAAMLEGFNEAVYDGGISLHPCAYLHNYIPDGIIDAPVYQAYIEKAPVFLRGAAGQKALREFIKKYVKRGDASQILFELNSGNIRPSKALADTLKGLLKGNQEFVLIDEQKQVYEQAMAAASSSSDVAPRVVVIEGGPGTGKTVLAINLLVALCEKGLLTKYVSKNAAPRKVYEAKLAGSLTKSKFASLFSGSGSFIEAAEHQFDVLLVDEAHRLNEKSGLYGNLGENQISELIHASKTTIFFLDENQRVTLDDIGSKEEIKRFARRKGAQIIECELPSQFRCNGSDGYLAWLDNTLGLRSTANTHLSSREYEFKVFESPSAMHDCIAERNGNNKARVVAGYCWPWLSKNDPTLFDIRIGDYQKRWNLDKDGSLWIMAEDSIHEVGCIHTCQGLELDYVGVIIGPDLVVRDGTIVTDPDQRARQDRTLKGYKSKMESQPEETRAETDLIIKNTYRTLMTRGMKGCFVYSADAETREYLQSKLTDI